MKTKTIIILLVALFILLLLAFTSILNVTTSNKDIQDLDEKSVLITERTREINLLDPNGEETQSKPRIVVSLTTIPERINELRFTLKSLLKQTLQPDEIAVNLPYKTLKGKEYILPEWLVRLSQKEKSKVKIHRLEKDFGPASKLLPTLKREHEDTKIICVDDDLVYPPELVYSLVKTSEKYPNNAITTFAKKLLYNGLNEPPRNGSTWAWLRAQRLTGNARSDLVLGVFGFLVKPKFFFEEKVQANGEIKKFPSVYDYSEAPESCIFVDDVFISGHLSLRNIDILAPQFNLNLMGLPVLQQQRTVGLIRTVNSSGKNDSVAIAYFWNMGAFQKR